MIKILQRKFILTAMTAITILILVLLGVLNLFNFISTSKQNDNLLNSLLFVANAPNAPDSLDALNPPDSLNTPSSPDTPNPTDTPHPQNEKPFDGFYAPQMNENIRMSAVYFVAYVNSGGNIDKINTEKIASVSDEDALSIVHQVLADRSDSGVIGSLKYRSTEDIVSKGKIFVFLDTSQQTFNFIRVLIYSVITGIVCWGLMLLLVIILSKKAIKPIAANLERQKQFVTDAGHEIKTPLAIILANTEAMELHHGQSKWSKNIRDQTMRLSGLMQNLLTLSKIDESNIAKTMENTDLSSLVTGVGEMFLETMNLKHISYQTKIDKNVYQLVNQDLYSRLCSILLDNAIKYSPENGCISVSLSKQNKKTILEIKNSCENMPECPPEKLFDRFYRADMARTQKSGGYGIGLSAAKSIADAHSGKITAEYLINNEIKFTVII